MRAYPVPFLLLLPALWCVAARGQQPIRVLDQSAQKSAGAEDSAAVTVEQPERSGLRVIVHEGEGQTEIEVRPGEDSTVVIRGRTGNLRRLPPLPPRGARVESDDMVAFGQDIHVPADKTVPGGVVAIFGSVHVSGNVMGDVVAIGGGVRIDPGSVVNGEVVSIAGGDIVVGDGAVVHGEAVTIGGRVRQAGNALVGDRVEITFLPSFGPAWASAAWVAFFAHLLLVGFAGWLLLRISVRRWGVALANLRARGWESLLAGIGGGIVWLIVFIPLLLVLGVALVAIVVGIPLVPALALLLLLSPLPGYVITATLLGKAILGRSGDMDVIAPGRVEGAALPAIPGLDSSFWLGHLFLSLPYLAAVFLHSLLHNWVGPAGVFMVLSWAVIQLAIALGWGAFLLSRFGRRGPLRAAAA